MQDGRVAGDLHAQVGGLRRGEVGREQAEDEARGAVKDEIRCRLV